MFRLLCLVVCLTAALTTANECWKLRHPRTGRCCNKFSKPPPDHDKHMKIMEECRSEMKKFPSLKSDQTLPKYGKREFYRTLHILCDFDICIAKKFGYSTEDDTLDKKAATELLDKEVGDAAVLEKIKKNCIDGDLSKYGPPEFCELAKFSHCYMAHKSLDCEEWAEDGECKEIKSLIETCI